MKHRITTTYRALRAWYQKYERVLIPGALVLGVVFDAVTFAHIRIGTAFFLLAGHLLMAGLAIAYVNAWDAGAIKKENRVWMFGRVAAPLIIQFTFGALLSAVFIFYVFSGSFLASWPFLLLVVVLMITNDVLRQYYLRARVQMAVYFFVLFLLVAVMLPFAFSRMGAWLFVVSGIVSLLFIYGYIRTLARFIHTISFGIRRFIRPIVLTYAAVNFMYFMNFVPPVPLALREAIPAHAVRADAGGYVIVKEWEPWLEHIKPGTVLHRRAGEPVFVYTAIFAPSKLRARMYHRWQWYDKERGAWVDKDRLWFDITGGRREGFRGYTRKSTVPAGSWRVLVETQRGQILGSVRFEVKDTTGPVVLREVLR